MNEKPTRDRSVGFTDASYIRQDDAPNMPRCYSFSEEKSSGTKKTVSPLRVGVLCLAFFVLGSLLTTAFSDAEKPVVNTKTAVLHGVDLHARNHGVAVRAVIILRRGAAHGLDDHAEIGTLAGGRARRGGGRIGMDRRGDRRGNGFYTLNVEYSPTRKSGSFSYL